MTRIALFLHLLGFAAFLGAGFSQGRFIRASRNVGLAPAIRDAYERLAAAIVTKIEVPASLVQLISGVLLIVENPGWLRLPWMHTKLTAVVLLLVLSHLEMFNARKIVKLRAAGEAGAAEIDKRKARHGLFGAAGALLTMTIVVLVSFFR
jgi:uncharacterized membrane protein